MRIFGRGGEGIGFWAREGEEINDLGFKLGF